MTDQLQFARCHGLEIRRVENGWIVKVYGHESDQREGPHLWGRYVVQGGFQEAVDLALLHVRDVLNDQLTKQDGASKT